MLASLSHAQEDHVASVRARNTLDSALFVWESRATVAVAIHFDKVRLKRAALRTLREVLPRARERNRAKAIERRRLLGASLPGFSWAWTRMSLGSFGHEVF